MTATDEQLERMFDLVKRFAEMRGRSLSDVILALLTTETLASYGYDGSGQLTDLQADAAVKVLEQWIEKAGGSHGGGGD